MIQMNSLIPAHLNSTEKGLGAVDLYIYYEQRFLSNEDGAGMESNTYVKEASLSGGWKDEDPRTCQYGWRLSSGSSPVLPLDSCGP